MAKFFTIEVFAGSGRLTAVLRTLGFGEGFGIDSTISKRSCAPILQLDLLQALEFEHARRLIQDPLCAYCHFAPPCGTSSRARHVQRPGRHSPPVLRTEQFPNGLPSLQGTNALRVQAANELYRRTVVMAKLCHANAVFWSIENPGRSYMWLTDDVAEFLQAHTHFDTFFHHCQYGSARRKLTRLVHNIPTFLALDKLCDNSHEHEPWGYQDHQCATALETAYPWPLCRALAQSLALCMQDLGAICKTPSYALQEASLQSLRAATDIQPRKHLPPMVSEFACVAEHPLDTPMPPLARKLSTPVLGPSASGSNTESQKVKIGIHWSPQEFIEKALEVGHPILVEDIFPVDVRRAIWCCVSRDEAQTAVHRTEVIEVDQLDWRA